MATAPRQENIRLTPQKYLEIERRAEFKSEFFDGVMYPREGSPHAMSGTSYRHTLISRNLQFEIHGQLKGGPCEVVSNDLRVAISGTSYTYPDLIIVCGEPQFIDGQLDTLINPVVLIEILSPSTQAVDRGRKFDHYRRIESLRHYILVGQESPTIERYDRQTDDTWHRTNLAWPDGILTLPDPAIAVPLREIYLGIFPA